MGRPDKRGVGRSKVVPYKKDELPSQRHERRLDTNLAHEATVRKFCADHQITFSIHNGGQHWKFLYHKKLIEWWPSSAKLVMNHNWGDGTHVHDYKQAIEQLKKRFKLQSKGTPNELSRGREVPDGESEGTTGIINPNSAEQTS